MTPWFRHLTFTIVHLNSSPMSRFCYRPLHKYKYQLVEEFTCPMHRTFETAPKEHEYVKITTDGNITIRKYYSWDGTSGIPDTKRNLRASLVHDALYQLMREGILNVEKDRDWSDRLFQEMCREDEVWPLFAASYYLVLKWVGKKHASPHEDRTPKPICHE